MGKQLFVLLREERGNITIFSMTIFYFMIFTLFVALFNFSTVFVDKQQAANTAQQATFAATKAVYEEIEDAIDRYDRSIARLEDPVFIWPLVQKEKAQLRSRHTGWADSEIHYAAIDNVLSSMLPGNLELQAYVSAGLLASRAKVKQAVHTILAENGASQSDYTIKMFTSDDRIEVKAAVEYESVTFGLEFMPSYEEQVYQTAQSRQVGFLDAVGFSTAAFFP
ncbi:hypothetical protein LOK74_14290 [Brevibacillus humidisoli]|uniref:pilus assembly protein TadG-related protein n=1 Tax=Brevibacillus humidisoli TaxID=2895522 RepID=UPI001E63CEF0|nr:pilus assembly protein TadG-related protein [Brevibacillus humidisoli]UFJ39239.1 hypothetical protein LOK74_14290 [Brevibacillus humidisoli]